ncbi:MAG: ABC transporter permease, partial [Shimia sp.]
MTRAVLQALAAHWRRHPLQLATVIVGLALATGLWTGVQAINAQARDSYDQAARALGQDTLDRLVRPGAPITQEDFVTLRRAGWQVSPVVEDTFRRQERRVTLTGIDPFTYPPSPAT